MGEGEGRESLFNEATFKMKRINDSQEIINQLRTNLLFWNHVFQKYNYEVVISALLNLLGEVWGKLDDKKEKPKAKQWRNAILDLLELYPVYTKSNGQSFIYQNPLIYNDTNWKKMRGAIFELEDFTRNMIELHGLSSPNVEDEGGWD